MSKNIFIGLTEKDWNMLVLCLDRRLMDLDQEAHFFQEEPRPEYYQLIELRDFILGHVPSKMDEQTELFTDKGNRV
jgi:hypothetical protein